MAFYSMPFTSSSVTIRSRNSGDTYEVGQVRANSSLNLGAGDDTFRLKDYIQGNVLINLDDGNDRFIFDEGASILHRSTLNTFIYGGLGYDTLEIYATSAMIISPTANGGLTLSYIDQQPGLSRTAHFGGFEELKAYGSAEVDSFTGGAGTDTLDGRGGLDLYFGSAGGDTYWFDTVGERVQGEAAGTELDFIRSTVSVDMRLSPNVEVVLLSDAGGAIDVTGDNTANYIYGNIHGNVIVGGSGNDYLVGAGGADTFVFSEFGQANKDTISDFRPVDRIQLDANVFAGLDKDGNGVLDPGALTIGNKLIGTNAQLLYDPKSGNLAYDADGKGAAPTEVIALLDKNLGFVDSSYFLIV